MSHSVQLFITCLGEHFFPGVLENMVSILRHLDVQMSFPEDQTCCGQPFFNSGFRSEATRLARGWLKAFSKSAAPVVSPSGSCVDMVRHHFRELFPPDSIEYRQVVDLAARTYEFSEYLVRVLGVTEVGARFPHRVTYHASCHLLRGLKVRQEPRILLESVAGLELLPLEQEETCCGFGGVFSVVYPEVSRSMLETKVDHITASGAEFVVAGDAGCLMNIGGGLRKAGSSIRAVHLIEVLAAR